MKPNKKLLRFLKQFFIQKPELHHPDDGHVLSTVAFYQLLDKERFRADRLSNPFSLVIIPLPEALQTPAELRHIISCIQQQARLIDELGWFAPGTLGLYLFNTPEDGARKMLSRVRSHLNTPELLDDVQVMVYPDTEQRNFIDENHRQQERVNLNLAATISPTYSGSLNEIAPASAITRDISASGAFLMTSTALPAGTQLELEVHLPIEELKPFDESGRDIVLKAAGHVVRSEAKSMAVQFDNPQCFETINQMKQFNATASTADNWNPAPSSQ